MDPFSIRFDRYIVVQEHPEDRTGPFPSEHPLRGDLHRVDRPVPARRLGVHDQPFLVGVHNAGINAPLHPDDKFLVPRKDVSRQASAASDRTLLQGVRSDVGQAFQPAGSADFPVRRNARLFRCRGGPAPSWGLTVPGTGRLDSLPYELKASLRHECPLLPIAPFFRGCDRM